MKDAFPPCLRLGKGGREDKRERKERREEYSSRSIFVDLPPEWDIVHQLSSHFFHILYHNCGDSAMPFFSAQKAVSPLCAKVCSGL
jgi:hypothetical protein